MKQETLNLQKRHEWMWRGKTFGVVASCHQKSDESWTWCLYALVYDNHELFADPTPLIESYDWHGGCTYDEKITNAPARGMRYEWQKERSYFKIGCDYAHYGDDYYECHSPDDGLPIFIQNDAQRLFSYLANPEQP